MSREEVGYPFPLSELDPVRFWDKVDRQTGGCWIWTGALGGNGYGRFKVAGVLHGAHRLSLGLATRVYPDALSALHSCHNRRCVNPAHLRWGTHQENMAEAKDLGRMGARRRASCAVGHPLNTPGRGCQTCKREKDAARMAKRRAGFYAAGLNSRGNPTADRATAEKALEWGREGA